MFSLKQQNDSVFRPQPITIFSYGAQICPPLVQLMGHVCPLRGHPYSTFKVILSTSSCTHLYTFKYPLPFVRTHFQYWILPTSPTTTTTTFYSERAHNTYLLQWDALTSTFNRFFYQIEIKRIMQRLLCRLFYLINGANWISITLTIFIFLFYWENLQEQKIYSRYAYVPIRFEPRPRVHTWTLSS